MVKSTCFQHTSSHPDKYNNSVDRIISKEEEREDPRRDSSIYLRVQWCFHILQRTTCNPASFQSSRAKKTILHTELILQETIQLQGSSRADHYKTSSSNCSHVSKHSTWQNKAPSSPTALAGFQLILPNRIALQVAASIHATPTVTPRRILTEFYQEI